MKGVRIEVTSFRRNQGNSVFRVSIISSFALREKAGYACGNLFSPPLSRRFTAWERDKNFVFVVAASPPASNPICPLLTEV
jgi:hypothetical protein